MKKAWLDYLGAILAALGIIAFVNSFFIIGISGIFWFSNLALFLTGIGILMRKPYLVAIQLCIVFIPYLFWNIDFFYVLSTGDSLWGFTDYFFQNRPLISQIITLEHVFLPPIALLALYTYKLKRKDFWKWSFVQAMLVFLILRILNQPGANINCVYLECSPLDIPLGPFPLSWFIGMFIMILVTNLILVSIKPLYREKTVKV